MIKSTNMSFLGLVTLAVGLAGCEPTATDSRATDKAPLALMVDQPRHLASPAGPGSGEPNLFAAGETVILSWLEVAEGGHELRFARLVGDEWTRPVRVIRRPDLFVNWADFPSVVELPDGSLAAHWLQYSGPGTYSYDVWVTVSRDGGTTWSKPSRPHSDGTPTEHGFVSLFASPTGHDLSVVWLDGRAYADSALDTPFMSLRYATLDAGGKWADRVVLDSLTCDCCQTSTARTSDGVIVAYRGRTHSEIRDIRVVRFESERWSDPVTVHDDGWEIPACPVNGPSISASGDTVAVAWFTAADDVPRVWLAYSDDGGKTFGSPIQVDRDRPLGRVAVSLVEGGAIVTWLEALEDGAGVVARAVGRDGRIAPPLVLGESSGERSSGFPVMVTRGRDLVVAWTVPGDVPGLSVVVAPILP